MRTKAKQRYRSRFLHAGNHRCPLCLREFDGEVVVTIEHVPPNAIDGRALCLTCRDCNELRAKPLDTALIDKSRGVVSGTITLPELRKTRAFKMKIEQTRHGVHISVPDSRIKDFFSDWRSILRSRGATFERLLLSVKENRYSDLGWLRHAYLALFAFFGDECLEWPSLETVRRQIQSPDSTIIGGYCIPVPDDCNDWEGIFIIGAPLWCWGIVFANRIVALPSNNDMTLYERLLDPERPAVACEATGIRGGFLPYSEAHLGELRFAKGFDICGAVDTAALFGRSITIADDEVLHEGVVVAHYADNRIRFWPLSTQRPAEGGKRPAPATPPRLQ